MLSVNYCNKVGAVSDCSIKGTQLDRIMNCINLIAKKNDMQEGM